MLQQAHRKVAAPRLAVVVNRHARGATPQVLRRLARLLPPGDLYVSETLADGARIADRVIARGYATVLLGGGDGTFTSCTTELRAAAARLSAPVPTLGVLKLGTGNALALALGATGKREGDLAHDLARATFRSEPATLTLLEVNGRLAPFAGVGLDAQVLADFNATTSLLDRVGVGRQLSAGVRYGLAAALRTTPRYFATTMPEVTAINRGAPAYRLTDGGRRLSAPIADGEVLWRGRATLASASTIPYFGLGLRMFPFADRMPGRFQLRCAALPAHEVLAELPSVWRGTSQNPAIADFLVDDVELQIERPVPIQIGGDIQAEPSDQLRMSLSDPIRVVG